MNRFARFFRLSPLTAPHLRVYDAIVAQARQPLFYSDFAVPDTVPGRYDMIVLHGFLLFERLSGEDRRAQDFSQAVHDALFADMDRSLREMGVGDLSVGKKIRKMAQVLYGRSTAYKTGLMQMPEDGGKALQEALLRNIYDGTAPQDSGIIRALADYVQSCHGALARQPCKTILAGTLEFPLPKLRETT